MLDFMRLTLSPAYGRDYKTATAVEEDFRNGRDFSVGSSGPPYTSIRDYQPGERVTLRYAKMRKSVQVTV